VQGGILNLQVSKVQLNDVVPLSLGVDNLGLLDVLIHRGDRVPTPMVERSYTTVIDKQFGAQVTIYQGERPFVADEGNTKLDALTLYGVTLAERGVPNLTVTFSIDEDGFLHVSVKDAGTGNEVSKIVRDSLGLSIEEIEARRHLAEERALEDAMRLDQFTLAQQAEDLKSRLRALLEKKRGSLPADLAGEVQQALEAPAPEDLDQWVNHLREVFQRTNRIGGTPESS
jgi:molecular chaperone DnaK